MRHGGDHNELKPLYEELKKRESSANLRTGVSRTLAIALGGVTTALALSVGTPSVFQASKNSQPSPATSRNATSATTQPNAGHQVSLNGTLLDISPISGGVNNAFPGKNGKYQVQVNGDIHTGATGTLTYKFGNSSKANMPVTLKEGMNTIITSTGEMLSILLVKNGNTISMSIID